MASDQMTMLWQFETAMGREDFIRAPSNAFAVELIEQWPNWPSLWVLLIGPAGAGKSHLARIWQEMSGAQLVTLERLRKIDPTKLVKKGPIILEDADRGGRDDVALFHLLNAAKEIGTQVLITARAHPDSWGVDLPDLASRLRLTTPVEISEPDDALLRAVLVKLFADHQLEPDSSVVEYIVLRMERSIEAAIRIVNLIDREALRHHKPVTRPFVSHSLKGVEEGFS